jgi:hypothetical protein
MELEVTWRRAIRVWVAWLWRFLIALFVAVIVVIALGFVTGPIVVSAMIRLGFQDETIKQSGTVFAYVFGSIACLLACIFPLKSILGKKWAIFD